MEQLIFESRQITKLTGISERRLRYFVILRVIVPDIAQSVGKPGVRCKYSLENVVDAYIANKLMDFGLTIPAIKRMLVR